MIVTTEVDKHTTVHMHNGDPDDPGFLTPTVLGPPQDKDDTKEAAITDINGDGIPDVVIANGPDQPSKLFLGDPNNPGNFEGKEPTALKGTETDDATSITVGDLNGDGVPDIVFGNKDLPTSGRPCCRQRDVDEVTGLQELEDSSSTTTTKDVAIADVDGDGTNDVVIVRKGDIDEVALNPGGTGPGTTTKHPLNPGGTPTESEAVTVVDLDGDGVPEVIVAIGDGDNELYRRDDPTTPGDGTTLPSLTKTDLPHPTGTPQLTGSTSVTTVDVDEDGDLDVLFTNDDGTMTTWINDGSGGLTEDTKNTPEGGSVRRAR